MLLNDFQTGLFYGRELNLPFLLPPVHASLVGWALSVVNDPAGLRRAQGRDCFGLFGEDRVWISKPPWLAWLGSSVGRQFRWLAQ
jgi:hypothetical protein